MVELRISIFGLGYVGLIHAVGFTMLGYKVLGYDIDRDKMFKISRGEPTVYEPGLKESLRRALDSGLFKVVEDPLEAVRGADVTFITVGTPSNPDGSQDLRYVLEASRVIGEGVKAKGSWHLVTVKSTVLPGTTEGPIRRVLEGSSGLEAFKEFGLASNPEFLREGSALKDFLEPERIVLGVNDSRSRDFLLKLYEPIKAPKIIVNIATAEMAKYASNAFLAVKLSFANEIANLCKILGIDSYEVLRIVGLDSRIGPHYLKAGLGFGGSCLPKDTRALIRLAEDRGYNMEILKAVLKVNEGQVDRMIDLIVKKLESLEGRKLGILGLAFKPHTDDIRESRGLTLALKLKSLGAEVHVHDPKALEKAREILEDNVTYHSNPQELLEAVEAVVIATEWPIYEELNYKDKIVFDGRRLEKARKEAKQYEGLAW